MNKYIHLLINDSLATLTFDREGSSANIFDHDCLEELNQHLDTIAQDSSVTGLVLLSAKEKIFIAGADISQFIKISDPQEVRELSKYGQETFARITDLPFPSVAAIHGQALGGGCEISLACDYRIASPDRVTKIGLPEINLGILPAWGGCYHLPRLIGLPKALDIILAGKTVPPYPAWKRGMIDQLCPREHFLRIAQTWIAKGKAQPKADWKTSNLLARTVINAKVRAMLLKKTRGHYPAPFEALKVCLRATTASRSEAFGHEQAALARLMQTSVCQNLVRTFFLQERAKKISLSEEASAPVDRLAVIGAGLMGAGIAQWHSSRGSKVLLKDINPEQVNKGMAAIGKTYGQALKRRIFTKAEAQAAMDRVVPVSGDLSLKNTPLVIEAATENMELKKKIFADLANRADDDTILATNTSALSISEIAASVPHPERVLGIHYFNPVHKMQLVELVLGEQTDTNQAQRALKFIQRSGKLPVVVNDRPGFLVNRVLMPYLIEAGRLFEGGANPKTLDECMLDFGMPMGPIRLIDEVGIDVSQHVADFFNNTFGARMPRIEVLDKLLEAGALGRKAGKGFYTYRTDKKDEPEINPAIRSWVKNGSFARLSASQLQERMVALMINEAAMCLEEGVVEAAEDIDFGMIFGTGFAPFRGGPMRHADSWGHANVVAALEQIEGAEICPRLKQDQTFYEPGENQ